MTRHTFAYLLLIAVLGLLPGRALAQLTPEQRCRNATAGLVLTMKTYRDVGQTREVALDQAELTPGSVRFRIADDAYRQLAAGTPLERVQERARAECLRVGPDVLEEESDRPEADGDGEGGRAMPLPVCADVATSIAALLAEDAAVRPGSLDDALAALRSSDPRDIPTPRLRRALEIALQRARTAANEQDLQRLVYAHCSGLDAGSRKALENEYYVP